MSDKVRLSGFVSAECDARSIGDLRELLKWCDKYGVSDDAGLDWGYGKLYVELTGDTAVSADWIECGDHMGDVRVYDVIITTHGHPEYEKDNGPDNYEEAREIALEKEPAKYDWPAKDRYGDERMPG